MHLRLLRRNCILILYLNCKSKTPEAGKGHVWFACVPLPLFRLLPFGTSGKQSSDSVMQYALSITGLAASMTGMTFADVAQSVCSATEANTGVGNNPKENISLRPLLVVFLIYLNKGELGLCGKSGMSLTTLTLLLFHFILPVVSIQ